MNGYASSIAALTERGLKVTRPVAPPAVIVVDTRVLAAAPPQLGAAGFGDLLSKPLSSADWLLAHWLLDEPLCPTALSLADQAVRQARRHAAGLPRGDPAAHGALIEALLLSGISMSIAGASSPASGGEHLLSHYLDISAEAWARPSRLHGEQVAVGTLVCRRLYAYLRSAGPPQGPAGAEEDDTTLRRLHGHLSPGALAALLDEARAARRRRPDRRARVARLQRDWRALWRTLDTQLQPAGDLERDLEAAGCPTRFSQIDVDPSRARRLLARARHMRSRYTVLDLAADMGLLEPFIARECGGGPEDPPPS
ncbi:MAG: iron-containing alcohol dehydrogenase [Acidobacteriota bacterium]|nr:iron-containing alcohol dehydrogenase [Acidobacteriota bacterium]